MKKTELINLIKAKFPVVGDLQLIERRQTEDIGWYKQIIYVSDGDELLGESVSFYVQNEGKTTEKAYFMKGHKNKVVDIPVEPNFQYSLNTYIETKIADGTIEGAFIEDLDNINATAVVKVVMDDSGILVEKRFFIDKDTSGNFQFRQIG